MIKSMTGFGDASAEHEGVHYALELRGLNNRYFKALVRVPEELLSLEAELETLLRQRVARGSLSLTVKMRATDARAASDVNEAALLEYLDHLETIQDKVHDHAVHIDLTQLLAMPGVLRARRDEEALINDARPVLTHLLDEALDRLTTMRAAEGRGLAKDLLDQRAALLDRLAIIRERSPHVIDEYHDRLRLRIDELMAKSRLKLDENDLIREVAIFAERSDISEEVQRLAAHLDQMESIIHNADHGPAGRTLDFLAQELLREANTIGSKCNDAAISRAVVESKGIIDRIKEQVQNVE